jgi:hypothetical protein
MAEKRAAIAAKKAARRAEERPSGERPSGERPSGDGSGSEEEEEEENAEGGWTDQEQSALEEALRRFPATLPKEERWDAISEHVGRSIKECVQGIKDLRAAIQHRQEGRASGGGGERHGDGRDGGNGAAVSGEGGDAGGEEVGDGDGDEGAADGDGDGLPDSGVTKPGKSKSKSARGKAGKAAENKAALEKRMAAMELKTVRGVPVASEGLPFHQRTGAFAAKRKTMSMDIRVSEIIYLALRSPPHALFHRTMWTEADAPPLPL